MKIAIIGAGWYGLHLALVLKKLGHDIVVFEANREILSQISGKFGIRLHAGPHYQRSAKTRQSCRRGFDEFIRTYPELVVNHSSSVYGLGKVDVSGKLSKVSFREFTEVARESRNCHLIAPESLGYQNLTAAIDIEEPSLAVDEKLRQAFKKYLSDAKVEVLCNFRVNGIKKREGKYFLNEMLGEPYDKVINATSYHSFLPSEPPPFQMDVVYQTCLALKYEDTLATERPFSFIVMDGWFPCVMPYNDTVEERKNKHYIVTHGKWTIMGSFNTANEAKGLLEKIDEDFILKAVKPRCESDLKRFWPDFENRFRYIGWQGAALAKIKTDKEFRSAVTFEQDGIIHVLPGKINNIFDVEQEVLALLANEKILREGSYAYMQDGVLHDAMLEITEKPNPLLQNTCTLQTYEELKLDISRVPRSSSPVRYFPPRSPGSQFRSFGSRNSPPGSPGSPPRSFDCRNSPPGSPGSPPRSFDCRNSPPGSPGSPPRSFGSRNFPPRSFNSRFSSSAFWENAKKKPDETNKSEMGNLGKPNIPNETNKSEMENLGKPNIPNKDQSAGLIL